MSSLMRDWNKSLQPLIYENVEPYITLAEDMRDAFAAQVAATLDSADVDLKVSPPCVKSQESSENKLGYVDGDPRRIRDYLRTEAIFGLGNNHNKKTPPIGGLAEAIQALKDSSLVLGWKDRFAYPEKETGYRDFKAHILVEQSPGSHQRIIAELKIVHAAMEDAYKVSERLRDMEREIRKFVSLPERAIGKSVKIRGQAEFTIASIRALRKSVHDDAAKNCGINNLIQDQKYEVTLPREFSDLIHNVDTRGGPCGHHVVKFMPRKLG